jgi:hypothetical protein
VSVETKPNDDAILAEMLRQSELLCRSADALLVGQYRHLQDRIRALIELRECARMVKDA